VPSRKNKRPLPGGVRRIIPAALCAAGMMAAWLAAPATSAQARPLATGPSGVIHSVASVPGEKAALAYWTPARLRAAKPADVAIAGAKPHVLPATGTPPGKPGHVAGGLPDGRGLAVTRPASASTPEAFPYPFPYDSFIATPSLWPTYPYEVNGALFFTNSGTGFVCSATAVASASGTSNENEIWTAGHCFVNAETNNHVVDSSAVFIPAYNGNVPNFDPFGEFVWTGSWETATAWYFNRDFSEDEAAATVGTSSTTGRTLGQAVGWDGFAWNQSVNQQFVAFGYPAASPYNGLNMVVDIAATAAQDSAGGADATKPIAIGDPMTGGSSGGAWNISWSPSGPGYIDGHNDYKYTSQPAAMYSPYQDTLSNQVRCFGKPSC